MKTYEPANPPDNPAQLPGFLRQELNSIEQAAHRAEPFIRLQITNIEPPKSQDGDIYEADGTNWNPGSGAGCYIKRSGSWVKLG